jgi:hypothetical protein
MGCVYFKDGYAYASNVHVLIKQSLDDYCQVVHKELLEGKCLHRDSFKNIREFDIVEATEDGVDCSNYDNGKKAVFAYSNQVSPNFEAVLSQIPDAPVPFIGLNPKNVEIVSKCLIRNRDGAMRLTFQGLDRPIIATVDGFPNQMAIIMPMLLGGNLF